MGNSQRVMQHFVLTVFILLYKIRKGTNWEILKWSCKHSSQYILLDATYNSDLYRLEDAIENCGNAERESRDFSEQMKGWCLKSTEKITFCKTIPVKGLPNGCTNSFYMLPNLY